MYFSFSAFHILLHIFIVQFLISNIMLPNNSLSFVTNNVKGIQSAKKRLKLMQYFKDKIESTGVSFLQETHSDSKVEQRLKEDLKVQFFLLTGSQILVVS